MKSRRFRFERGLGRLEFGTSLDRGDINLGLNRKKLFSYNNLSNPGFYICTAPSPLSISIITD